MAFIPPLVSRRFLRPSGSADSGDHLHDDMPHFLDLNRAAGGGMLDRTTEAHEVGHRLGNVAARLISELHIQGVILNDITDRCTRGFVIRKVVSQSCELWTI